MMIDGEGGGEGAAEAGADGGAEGSAGGGEQGGGAPGGGAAAPDWMSSLPDDLKADPTLQRYGDVEKLARGAIDLKRQASSRVILPGEGADEAAWNNFYNAIGRPETADKYEIPVPDGADTRIADAFRPVAHKLGLTAAQAKGIVEFNNSQVADQLAEFTRSSEAELAEFKKSTPEYDAKLARAKSLAKDLGVTPEVADALDVKLGTTNLMKFFFNLADRAGEHGRIDGEDPNLGGSTDPSKDLDAKMKDADWRAKVKIPGTPERAEYDRLLAAARAQATRKSS